MLAVWELGFQENWLEWLPVLRLFIQTIGFLFCEHLLSFWDSGILAAARQMVPTWLTPSKNPGLQYLGEFSGQIAFYIRCHSSLLGKLSASCVTPLGKDPRMPIPGFFQTLPHVPFLLLFLHCYSTSQAGNGSMPGPVCVVHQVTIEPGVYPVVPDTDLIINWKSQPGWCGVCCGAGYSHCSWASALWADAGRGRMLEGPHGMMFV